MGKVAKKVTFNNTLYTGDNLYIMNGMNSEQVDLIYTDPPFNSKRFYSAPIGSKAMGAAFKDIWTWNDVDSAYLDKLFTERKSLAEFIDSVQNIHSKAMASYIAYMAQRIIEMHRILKPNGSFYLHIDPTASHYLKIICDEVFGKNNFINEIAWCYSSGGVSKKWFSKKHDIILFYSKSKTYQFNPQYRSYSEGTLQRGLTQYKKDLGGYELNEKGALQLDWWSDITPLLSPTMKERTGFPTQKPLSLLHRIIKASSNEDDLIFDPFCGCATAMVAAQQLNRKWIGIDIEEKAAELVVERLSDDNSLFDKFMHTHRLPMRTDIKIEQPTQSVKVKLHKLQEGLCNGCQNEYLIKDFHIDHIIPKAKGGQDVYENYQLLCGNCNSIKGSRPMEYLVNKIKARKATMEQTSYT